MRPEPLLFFRGEPGAGDAAYLDTLYRLGRDGLVIEGERRPPEGGMPGDCSYDVV